jgi:hypothetical protein
MLAVFNWLNDGVKTVDDVKTEMTRLKVEVKTQVVGDKTIVLLNYEDDAPRTDEKVIGCRGTVWLFDGKQWTVICATMDRFFNHGENGSPDLPDLKMVQFQEKEDGSLAILYWNPIINQWMWKTRNTFDLGTIKVGGSRNLLDLLKKIDVGNLMEVVDKNVSYMFELCTTCSTVVVQHDVSKLVVLSARSTTYPFPEVSIENLPTQIPRPRTFKFNTVDECKEYIKLRDPRKYEGMVAKFGSLDNPFRVKIKSPDFVAFANTSRVDTPAPEQIIAAIMKNDLPELLATHNGKWDKLAQEIQSKLVEFHKKVKIIDELLVATPPNPPLTKKEEAEIIKKSVCPAYHFARAKYVNVNAFLLKMDLMQVLKLIGAENSFI